MLLLPFAPGEFELRLGSQKCHSTSDSNEILTAKGDIWYVQSFKNFEEFFFNVIQVLESVEY